MEAIETIKKRRSIRDYKEKAIPREVIESLVDAARFAPTARAAEPWEFVVVTKPSVLQKMADITDHGKFIAQAKACIAVWCQDTKYYLEDGSAATQNILLAATALGIGSCWVAGDKKPYCGAIGTLLGVPPFLRLISLISLGYPASRTAFYVARKRELKDLLHWEKF